MRMRHPKYNLPDKLLVFGPRPKKVTKMLNKVVIMGRLTKDPELRYTTSGTPVALLPLQLSGTIPTRTEKSRLTL